MDFTVKRVDKDLDEWDIFNGETKVGRIEMSRSYIGQGARKSLYVGDTKKWLGHISNQKEAVQTLQKFFEDNKKEIQEWERLMSELEAGKQVLVSLGSAYMEKLIAEDYKKLEKERNKLLELDLV